MIALLDVRPNFCPICGGKIEFQPHNWQDWNNNRSFVCRCGFSYQLAETSEILSLAHEIGGDLQEG